MCDVARLLERSAAGKRLTPAEGLLLYREAPLHELGAAAHQRRTQLHPGREVSYVIDTTINYTNICDVHCSFCAFFRPEGHAEGYTMSHDEVLQRVAFAAERGATQIMIQGGVNPQLPISYYTQLFEKVTAAFPDVDIHSLSTSEICGIAKREQMTVDDVLLTLRAAGLKSLPGAGAEILVERVRKRISARKIDDDRW
ncbi:MAG: radical SAM protein, partial [Candidatus Eremiobacteraeota bacterium]|nr:radical SAM protein [Candidatus Eremiobacteraeota bacterium]